MRQLGSLRPPPSPGCHQPPRSRATDRANAHPPPRPNRKWAFRSRSIVTITDDCQSTGDVRRDALRATLNFANEPRNLNPLSLSLLLSTRPSLWSEFASRFAQIFACLPPLCPDSSVHRCNERRRLYIYGKPKNTGTVATSSTNGHRKLCYSLTFRNWNIFHARDVCSLVCYSRVYAFLVIFFMYKAIGSVTEIREIN